MAGAGCTVCGAENLSLDMRASTSLFKASSRAFCMCVALDASAAAGWRPLLSSHRLPGRARRLVSWKANAVQPPGGMSRASAG
eukprot:351507-Chlamydomonas_euryale.AAC.2